MATLRGGTVRMRLPGDRVWRRATAVAVGVGVSFSVLLVGVSSGVSNDIRTRLRLRGLAAFHHLDVHKIDSILIALTVVVTTSMLVQTAVATYTQGVNAMANRREEIAIRRQSGVLRSTLVAEFVRSALLACLVGGVAGEVVGVAIGLGLRVWTVVPVRFGWISLLGPFPVAVGVALAATVLPAWRAANVSPALLRRG